MQKNNIGEYLYDLKVEERVLKNKTQKAQIIQKELFYWTTVELWSSLWQKAVSPILEQKSQASEGYLKCLRVKESLYNTYMESLHINKKISQ